MAGWFPMDLQLEDKPKFKVIVERLGLDEHEYGPLIVAGALRRFWAWMDTTSNDGYLAYATAKMIDSTVGIKGFAAAMESVHWLELSDDGARMPGFEEHHSTNTKKRIHDAREAAAKRRSERRQPPQPQAPAKDAPKPESSRRGQRDKSREARDESRGDGDLHRQTDRQTSPPPTPASEADDDGPLIDQEEAEEERNSLGPEWESAIVAVEDAGVMYAVPVVHGARAIGHSPEGVVDLCSVYREFAGTIGGIGKLVDRLRQVRPRVDRLEGWGKRLKKRDPTPPDESAIRERFYADGRSRNVPDEEIERRWLLRLARTRGAA
jgi:hypothetical protein